MKMKNINWMMVTAIVLLFSCKPQIDEFTPEKGTADFSSYLALGDNWSAGLADAAVYKTSQEMSFPAILATQFAKVGGGEFRQPLMLDDIGIGLGTGVPQPKLELAFRLDCKGATGLTPGYVSDPINPANLAPLGDPNPFNNISVPAMMSIHIGVPGYGGLNPYYGRFAASAQSKVLEEIPRVNPTFFSLALGSYDVLGYALFGGEGQAPTPQELFAGSLQAALQTLTANGAKGAVANIPDILTAPFFTTIPYYALVLTEQAQVDGLNAGYAALNQIIKGSGSDDTLHFVLGPNPMVIQDAALPWGRRQIHSDELLLMSIPQDSLKCAGWGSLKPIANYYVLDSEEIAVIEATIENYNSAIQQMATTFDLAYVDFYQMSVDLTYKVGGLLFDGVSLNSKLVTGNFYSLDGLAPTPMGSAVVARYFVEAINAKYNAKIPQVIIADYPAVKFP